MTPPPDGGVTPLAVPGLEPGGVTPELEGTPALEPPGGVTPEALGIAPERTEFGAVTPLAVIEFKAGGTILTGALNAVLLEKSADVELGVVLEEVISGVEVLEGERLVVVTPNAGVLTPEGSEAAFAMAVLELGVDAGVLEVWVVDGLLALEVGGAYFERLKLEGQV